MTILLAACSPGEVRIALADGDRLLDYAIWRPGAPDGLGDLHLGRVEAVLPALGGAFVALAGAGSGFLPIRDGERRLLDGDAVPVRVVRSAQAGKGPRLQLAAEDLHDGADRAGAPRLLERGPDPLAQLAAAHPEAAIVLDDPGLAATLPPALRSRVRLTEAAFPEPLLAQIEALASPDLALPGGLRASIHPTPALVAIDVDGGTSSAGRQPKQHAQFGANRAAIGPLLHQLRLRNLSGAILIDLAGLASRKRAALRPEIEAALARDPLAPRLLGFTALGLVEILRPRHPSAAARAAGRAARRRPRRPAGGAAARWRHRRTGCRGWWRAWPSPARWSGTRPRARPWRRGSDNPSRVRTDAALPDTAWSLDHG